MPRRRSVRVTRTAISPRLAIRTVENTAVARLHPEDAVADRLQRRVGADRQGEADHRPGVHRVDDAVVPEPSRGVVGVTLPLVLLADRRGESGLVSLGPRLAALLQGVAPDGRQDRRGLLATHHRDAGVGPGEEE